MLLSGGKFPLRFLDFGFQKRFQLGIQLKALIEVLICPDLVALKQPGQSSVSVCLGKGWIDIDGLVVVGNAAGDFQNGEFYDQSAPRPVVRYVQSCEGVGRELRKFGYRNIRPVECGDGTRLGSSPSRAGSWR